MHVGEKDKTRIGYFLNNVTLHYICKFTKDVSWNETTEVMIFVNTIAFLRKYTHCTQISFR